MIISKYSLLFLLIVTVSSNMEVKMLNYTSDDISDMLERANNATLDKAKELFTTTIKDNTEMNNSLAKKIDAMGEKMDGMGVKIEQLEKENRILKTKGARSCKELKEKGFTESGMYEIDPNSAGSTIQVHCDMLTGTTEIGHDNEETVEIEFCSGDGCFNQEYNYSAPMNQVEALIVMSETCEQEIKYNCNIAPLKANGLYGFYYGWWVDRHEQKQFYFDGSNEDLHVCGCYPNCQQAMFNSTCNCDSSLVPFWNSDSGKITNKNSLPIKAFSYGGFISNQQKAKITVGKLRCSGMAPKSSDLTSTCSSLKKGGASVSGYYLIKQNIEPQDNLQISYCKMSQPGYQEETLRVGEPQEINKNQKIIDIKVTSYTHGSMKGYIFNHHLQRDSGYLMSSLKVSDKATEEQAKKNGLDLSNGIWTVKESGIYVFSSQDLWNVDNNKVIKSNIMHLASGQQLAMRTSSSIIPFDFVAYKLE